MSAAPRTALALSPHLDDAAFSCGGTLAQLARRGWRVVVATVFTATMPDPWGFALACQLDKGLGPEVDYMALRRAEDAAAMAALGAEPPVHMPFPEAPHRGYDSAAALFAGVRADDPVAAPLADALRALVHVHTPDLILAPQAIGGHADHILVVEALARSMVHVVPVLWWRDFPYVSRGAHPAEPLREAFADLPEQVVTLEPGDLAARRAACLAYASQLGFQFGGPAGLEAKLAQAGPTEHFRGAFPDAMGGSEAANDNASP